ncbi:MAG TPA: DUF4922 domain-containing protein [Bacteroidales bacterium]|nr:DUF4922 domain-containing protein [Bacteroidales bacterium]
MFSDRLSEFFTDQLGEWDLARTNYRQLEKVQTRSMVFQGFQVLVQFNPERIRSSAAEVDDKSIGKRQCFLCEKNRPPQQRGVPFESEFTILVNPYPIFRRHLTIVSGYHTGQRIRYNFGSMLSLAEVLPEYVIFYNGPQCGASAPDHLHFQAGNRGFMPIEKDFSSGRFAGRVFTRKGAEVWHWKDYLRGIISLKGSQREPLETLFHLFFERFDDIRHEGPEPMLNILTCKEDDQWIIHIIPRKQHRPVQFYAVGDDQIILSPASVDLGGVVITPREEDFNKITMQDISNIFGQVCFGDTHLHQMILEIK